VQIARVRIAAALAVALAALLVAALAGCAGRAARQRTAGTAAAALIGTWRLVSFESRAGGEARYPLGRSVQGQLIYDAAGHMSAHLMMPDRPRFASGDRARGTDAEVRVAFVGYLAYYGTYTVDHQRGTVTHHVEGASFPNWVGSTQLRHLRLEGARLTLTTPPIRAAGEELVTVLTWERVR
jgi:hypothetical protein